VDIQLRHETAALLRREIAAMNIGNFVVRPKRKLVEKYAKPEAWSVLTPEDLSALSHDVAGLPTELDPEGEEAKRFDLLILNLQLAKLRVEPTFARLQNQVREIAGLLEEKDTIPMVHAQMALILELQTDEWWQDVTLPMLETVRRRLRDLVKFIDKQQRKLIYTDFEDQMGEGVSVALPGLGEGTDYAKFRDKAQAFLRAHQDHIAIHKLRTNKPLTATDLAELEKMLVASGVGSEEEVREAANEARGLGLFVRSLIGLDRGAAKEALAAFLTGKTLNSSQIDFVNLIIDHLTEHGLIDAAMLYESPFTDLTPRGPDALFDKTELDELFGVLDTVRAHAAA
jgi:type I restriction enzyme, R subunit